MLLVDLNSYFFRDDIRVVECVFFVMIFIIINWRGFCWIFMYIEIVVLKVVRFIMEKGGLRRKLDRWEEVVCDCSF